MAHMEERYRKMKQKNKPKCFSDYITDVPKIVTNNKKSIAYDLLQFLGSGSFGKCYEVTKQSTGEHFACKVMSKKVLEDEELLKFAKTEIRIHRKLKHEHVVDFIESFEDEKYLYMIQALCSNYSLRHLQLAKENFTINDCRYIISQILKGVQYIHEQEVIHRDIKLSNILIDESMQMKICDFGMAIRAENAESVSKAICGTVNFLAPEVVNKHGYAYASDIWAVGVITYLISHGYKPFECIDKAKTFDRIKRVQYTLRMNIDIEIGSLIRKIFVKDIGLRLTAANCLKQDFFTKHKIPHTIQNVQNKSITEQKEPSCIIDFDFAKLELSNASVHDEIEYPSIVVTLAPEKPSTEQYKYAEMLSDVFQRFDAICRSHDEERDSNMSDFNDADASHPKLWIAHWTYRKPELALVYIITNGVSGIMFNEGLKLMHTPDNKYWSLELGKNEFQLVSNVNVSQFKSELEGFDWLKGKMLNNIGNPKARTPYKHRDSFYVYTWVKTDVAMIMVLSNMTLQINFAKEHKKMLICPNDEKVTFFKNHGDDFQTETFATIESHKLSDEHFEMLKYATAVIKMMSEQLHAKA